MAVFSQNPGKFLASFSAKFKHDFLDVLKTMHPGKWVKANTVYQQYIKDKQHVHMNSTCWSSLAGFVRTVGSQGICEVEETEKGWLMKYIAKDRDELQRAEDDKKRELHDLTDMQRQLKMIEKQIEAAKQMEKEADEELEREGIVKPQLVEETGPPQILAPIVFNVKKPTIATTTITSSNDKPPTESQPMSQDDSKKRKLSNMEQIVQEEQEKKRAKYEKFIWLKPDIVVKIMHKSLSDGQYYKLKGIVNKVDGSVAEIEMIDSGDVLRVDQDYLETVIPQIGNDVRILKGEFRGYRGTLEDVDFDKCCATIKVVKTGDVLRRVEYEDFSKIA
jgi:DNA/RNA-binding protein KIN17